MVISLVGLLLILIVLFGMVMLDVGFNVILVIIFCLLEILFKMLLEWLEWKFCGVSGLWCWLFFWCIILKLLLILIFFMVLMFIKVWVIFVFKWLNIGLFKLIGMLVVIIWILVLIELFFFFSLWISLLNVVILLILG